MEAERRRWDDFQTRGKHGDVESTNMLTAYLKLQTNLSSNPDNLLPEIHPTFPSLRHLPTSPSVLQR